MRQYPATHTATDRASRWELVRVYLRDEFDSDPGSFVRRLFGIVSQADGPSSVATTMRLVEVIHELVDPTEAERLFLCQLTDVGVIENEGGVAADARFEDAFRTVSFQS